MIEPETKTRWTCSRCRKVEITKGALSPPHWIFVGFRPLGSFPQDLEPPHAFTTVGYLCNPCGGDFVDWVNDESSHVWPGPDESSPSCPDGAVRLATGPPVIPWV